ncbi:MAG: hypothetical protein JJU29_22850 [Verrucomicrobia bacterium]|nr:hypothetical protein [Verrucomicrobiota bacterium]MCH8514645.1 hypothetical protein [Kiritimatiellia bacterium]
MDVIPKPTSENTDAPETRWTWEGNEREQFRAFRSLPILEKLKAGEEMCDVVEQLSKPSADGNSYPGKYGGVIGLRA